MRKACKFITQTKVWKNPLVNVFKTVFNTLIHFALEIQ